MSKEASNVAINPIQLKNEEIFVILRGALKKIQPSGYQFILFGSRARGNNKERSDFDIGILGDKPLDNKTFFMIEDVLQNLPTLYKIDLVDLQTVSDPFRQEALKDYILLT